MAVKVKFAGQEKWKHRYLLYGDPGTSKTPLAVTAATPGKKDMLILLTDGRIQSIEHTGMPYVDINRASDYQDVIDGLKAGKKDRETGTITAFGMDLTGILVDNFADYVRMEMEVLLTGSPRAATVGIEKVIDDAGQYEYKQINSKIPRKLVELRSLPLRYIGMTAYVQSDKDDEGNVIKVYPKFLGNNIWPAVSGSMDYVFHITAPVAEKDMSAYRNVRTQPTATILAKTTIPGVGGKLAMPSVIKFNLGSEDLLRKVFAKCEDTVRLVREGTPQGDGTATEIKEAA